MSDIQQRLENVSNALQTDITKANNLPDFVISQEDYDTIESQADDLLGGSPAPIVVAKPNVFVQSTEPTSKDGIWLQTNNYQMSNVTATDMLTFTDGSWNTTKMAQVTDLPYSFNRGVSVSIGADIYFFGGGSGTTNRAYKYNTLTDTYTQLANTPLQIYYSGIAVIDTDIYLFGGSYNRTTAYKYDILTNAYIQLANIPYTFSAGSTIAMGTDIYLFGSGYGAKNKSYKYNILTNTYVQLSNIPYDYESGSVTSVGTNIYLFGSVANDSYNKYAYKYDTLTDTYTKLTDIPYKFVYGAVVSVGTSIFIFGGNYGNTSVYKYDTLLNDYVQLTDSPYGFTYSWTSALLVESDDTFEIYLLGGEQNPTKLQILELDTISFNNNNVIVLQDKPKYNTKLLSNGSNIKDYFDNAWFYTTQDGLIKNIPTYYGNGTSWIKFKN